MGELFSRLLALFEGVILAPIKWLWPLKWVIVPPGSAAVRFTFGRPSPDLGQNSTDRCRVYFATSCQSIYSLHVARHAMSTEAVKALTSDGVPVEADAVFTYSIANLGDYLTQAFDTSIYVSTVVEACVLNAIQKRTYADLVSDLDGVQSEMRKTLHGEVRPLGVKILAARFQNIQHLDPLTRAMLSSRVGSAAMLAAAQEIVKHEPGIGVEQAVAALAPGISYVWDIQRVTKLRGIDVPAESGD